MMGRGGFALISVLWLIAMLTVVFSTGLRSVEVSRLAAENRLSTTRAVWAARGCMAMTQLRHSQGRSIVPLDSLALGPTTWCRVASVDPSVRINPNMIDSIGLIRVLGDPVMVASLLDWIDRDAVSRDAGAERSWYMDRRRRPPRDRPMVDVREITLVRGFEGSEFETLDQLFTTRGDGRISPNRASKEVLSTVSVLPGGAADRLVELRGAVGRLHDASAVVAVLGLEPTVDEFQELVRRLEFDDRATVLRVEGLSNTGTRLVTAELTVTLAIRPDRLAIRRVEWR